MKVLVTGAAGFIGMHAAERLLQRGDEVLGLDDLNDYYSVRLKNARVERLRDYEAFTFRQTDIAEPAAVRMVFDHFKPQRVLHLAAQAGVRHSLTYPETYVRSNLVGFCNVIECCRQGNVEHLAYASSSSVYGGNIAMPFNETQKVDHPLSLYAATKRANELVAHTYSHLHLLPTTGLRFFTVYGPWGRPDMSPILFARSIIRGEPIKVFNHGNMVRDFTYVDDVVEGVTRVLDKPATGAICAERGELSASVSAAPYRVFNIGNNTPVSLLDYIGALEEALGRRAIKEFLPMQPGDVPGTAADTTLLEQWVNFRPSTPLATGIRTFANWYVQNQSLM
jgi:UDP-glucuronate 4-epimerase